MEMKQAAMPINCSEGNPLGGNTEGNSIYKQVELHPTHRMQENALQNQQRKMLQEMSVQYGSHLAMRYVMDATIFSKTRRLGGYGSNMHGLNSHMGRYDEIDAFDLYGQPRHNPERERETIHARLATEYGL